MTQPIDRFTAKVRPDPVTGCHNWTASTNGNGYGKFFVRKIEGRPFLVLAHRWAYERYVGPIPAELVIDHLCFNRLCVNPAHLEAVTNAENLRRTRREMRAQPGENYWTHCKRGGHELTPDNVYIAPKDGKRRCRACASVRATAWSRKNRAALRAEAANA